MTDSLWQLNATQLLRGTQSGKFSCEDVMMSVIARIDEHNPALNAIVNNCADLAVAQSREADKAIRRGDNLGPLHGLPITIKTNVDVEGQPTPNGIPNNKDVIATENSPVVQNMLDAGGVIVGRTNTPEFSMRITTDNPLHGRTYNPWCRDASPGGSSGGAAVAAVAGFGPIHHGNDIGGSLRYPASFCGAVTLKPTFGRVPNFVGSSLPPERGFLAQLMGVQGAVCREVTDLRIATRVMASGDPRDPFWMPAPFYGDRLKEPIRVGITRESYGYLIDQDILSSLDHAAEHLTKAGYCVEEITTPSMDSAARTWFELLGTELQASMMSDVAQFGSPVIQKILGWYFDMVEIADADAYQIGIKERTAVLREWSLLLDSYPLVLTPLFMRATPSWDCDARSYDQYKDICQAATYSIGANFLSLPAGVVPIGLVNSLPSAIQIIGRRYREDLVLDAMEVIESEVGIMAHQLWINNPTMSNSTAQ
ncbi:MAG: amidase [Acidiferrobacteraceae bacterium]|nr:amidase [Acidiferrobacteraceae bacterium]